MFHPSFFLRVSTIEYDHGGIMSPNNHSISPWIHLRSRESARPRRQRVYSTAWTQTAIQPPTNKARPRSGEEHRRWKGCESGCSRGGKRGGRRGGRDFKIRQTILWFIPHLLYFGFYRQLVPAIACLCLQITNAPGFREYRDNH